MIFELPSDGAHNVGDDNCVFCSIVSGDAEASWEASPSSDSRVACFHNRLKWMRVMLLVIPTQHMTQREFWTSDVLGEAAEMAVDMGDQHCGSEGYRIISNFGLQAHQSVSHAHLHVISEMSRLIENGIAKSALSVDSEFSVDEFEIDEIPFTARVSPAESRSQRDMWKSSQIIEAAGTALEVARRHSANGFRLMSSFYMATQSTEAGSNDAGLFLLGGGQLRLYGDSY